MTPEERLDRLENAVGGLQAWATHHSGFVSAVSFVLEVAMANSVATMSKAAGDAFLADIASPYRDTTTQANEAPDERVRQGMEALQGNLDHLVQKIRERADEIRQTRAEILQRSGGGST